MLGVVRIAGLAIPALLTVTGAHAAPSFDCAKASRPIEKAICADTKLSDMDAKLAAGYRAALLRLSPQAQEQVRDSQRQWLKYVRTVCDTTALPKAVVFRTVETCLRRAYETRQNQIDSAVKTQSGRTFYMVEIFKALRNPDATDRSGPNAGFVTLNISYPQLDNPTAQSDRALNAHLAAAPQKTAREFPPKGEETGKVDEDVASATRLSAALPGLISFDGYRGGYRHGAAHGLYPSFSFHWLPREGRELKAGDIFSTGAKWQDFLRERCFDGVKHFGAVKAVKDIGATPEKPSNWSFDKKGLTVTFGPYEVASYADGQPTVIVPWSELKPYLAPGAPAFLAGLL